MKRVFSILVSMVMIVTMFGSFSFAGEETNTTEAKAVFSNQFAASDQSVDLEGAMSKLADKLVDKLEAGQDGEATLADEDVEYLGLVNVTANSFTITWQPNYAQKYVVYSIDPDTMEETPVSGELPAGSTSCAFYNVPAGYIGVLDVYGYTGTEWVPFAVGVVNTKPLKPAKANISISEFTDYNVTLSHKCALTDVDEGVQYEIIKCGKTSGRRAIAYASAGKAKKFSTVLNTGYKYRARRVFNNTIAGRVFYGNWCGWKYFDMPTAKMTAYSTKKIKVYLKRAVGVKSYKIYIKKGTGSYKWAKTVKVTSKSSYTTYLYKCYGSKLKRGTTYKVKVVPIMKGNGAASPIIAVANCRIP